MSGHPGVIQVSGGSSSGDSNSEVKTHLVTEETSNPGQQLPISTRDESTSDVSLDSSGALDCSLVRVGGSPEKECDEEEEWPDGVEVECKLVEATSGPLEDPSSHATNKERGGCNVSVIKLASRRSRRRNAGVAGPSGEVGAKSEGQTGPSDVGGSDGIDLVKSSHELLSWPRHLTRPYGCELCDYRGKYRSDLEAHMRTHTGEKPFACELCDYRGTHSSHLRYHMRTHTGEKPFICSICGYRCIHAGRLKDHMMVHTGEKPYSCNLCEFRCSRTGILKRHIRMHTGEKPYACDICDYRCSETGTLKSHKRIHTGEKPYACDRCDYRSVQASALRKHKRTHNIQNSQLARNIIVNKGSFSSGEAGK